VIKADSVTLSDARLALTKAIKTVMYNALNLIGVVAPEKM
jgi:arginyl-tRNA synthetase